MKQNGLSSSGIPFYVILQVSWFGTDIVAELAFFLPFATW